jgi:hypothetical protein
MKIKIPTLFRKGRERREGHPLWFRSRLRRGYDARASRRIRVESSK